MRFDFYLVLLLNIELSKIKLVTILLINRVLEN